MLKKSGSHGSRLLQKLPTYLRYLGYNLSMHRFTTYSHPISERRSVYTSAALQLLGQLVQAAMSLCDTNAQPKQVASHNRNGRRERNPPPMSFLLARIGRFLPCAGPAAALHRQGVRQIGAQYWNSVSLSLQDQADRGDHIVSGPTRG